MAEMTAAEAIAWLTEDKAFGQECYSRKQIAQLIQQQAQTIEAQAKRLEAAEKVCNEAKEFCKLLRSGKPQTFHSIEKSIYLWEKVKEGQ